MKHARAWLVAFVGLWWLWMLLVGEWNHYEWIAATATAAVAATLGEIARTRAGVHTSIPRSWLTRGWSALVPRVFIDFAIVIRALLRRHPPRGVLRERPLPAKHAGVETWVTMLADYSPNAYVVDVDADRGVVLLHDLIPNRKSEEPA